MTGRVAAADDAKWIHRVDLTEEDFEYIHPMLEDSFDEWFQQQEEIAMPHVAYLAVFSADGMPLAWRRTGSAAGAPELEAMLSHTESWRTSRIGSNAVGTSLDLERPFEADAVSHDAFPLRKYTSLAVPIFTRDSKRLFAVIGAFADSPAGEQGTLLQWLRSAALHYRSCFYMLFERLFVQDMLLLQEQVSKESVQQKKLFRSVQKLYDQIDVDAVLSEMMVCVEDLYPSVHASLFVSQDNRSPNPFVKPLVFHSISEDLRTRTFVEGKMMTERIDDATLSVAVPLSGKQGIYGVLQLTVDNKQFEELDMKMISMLAEAAGTAFEKARLYEQSNVLIDELRLINEITKRLNQSLKLNDIIHFASSELLQIFNADYCCILQLDQAANRFVVASGNTPMMENDNFSTDYGFCGVMYATKEPIIVSDYWSYDKVESKLMRMTNSRSLMAAPIIDNGIVVGAILVTDRKANYFTYDNYKLLQVLSSHIGLALANASLHAEVRRMVITDNLTGLYARHYLNEQINYQQKKDFCGSLIVVDIDNFKRINDTYGHQVGDEILVKVSSIIRSSIRETDIAARWGGEELAVYLPQVSLEQTMRVAERIRYRVEKETYPKVTVSCGVSEWNWEDDKISVESLFYRADMALYEAKNTGKNQVKIG